MIWRILLIWLSLLSCVFGNFTRTGTFTVTGATPAPAASVTVNGATAQINGDFTFAVTNNTLANGNNTFTIIAQDVYGAKTTNSVTVNLPTNVVCQYSLQGNLINDGTRVFSYDGENQLTNVFATNLWQVCLLYDGLNRRRIERDYAWQGGAWVQTNETRFIYDGRLVLQERGTNNNPLVTYTRGLDFSMSLSGAGGIGGMLARTDTNGSTFYHCSGEGNITALIDTNQNIVGRAEYDGFNRFLKLTGPMASANHYWASSMQYFPTFNEYGYSLRIWDASWQTFTTPDPVQEAGGFNLYQAAGNNPVNNIDPYGLWIWFGWFRSQPRQPAPYDPNSYKAMRDSMIGDPSDYDFNGQSAGQVTKDIGMAVPKGIINTAAAMLGPGEAESAYAAADEALQAARAAKAGAKCKTVLGRYPNYLKQGEALGANVFNIPTDAWEAMSAAEKWAANQKFLDAAIARGDSITLASPLSDAVPGSWFDREIQYLASKGYVPNAAGTEMLAPQ